MFQLEVFLVKYERFTVHLLCSFVVPLRNPLSVFDNSGRKRSFQHLHRNCTTSSSVLASKTTWKSSEFSWVEWLPLLYTIGGIGSRLRSPTTLGERDRFNKFISTVPQGQPTLHQELHGSLLNSYQLSDFHSCIPLDPPCGLRQFSRRKRSFQQINLNSTTRPSGLASRTTSKSSEFASVDWLPLF